MWPNTLHTSTTRSVVAIKNHVIATTRLVVAIRKHAIATTKPVVAIRKHAIATTVLAITSAFLTFIPAHGVSSHQRTLAEIDPAVAEKKTF